MSRFDAYEKAAQLFTKATAHLMLVNVTLLSSLSKCCHNRDKDTAAAEIDRVLTTCVISAKPVYLTLPTDLVYAKIPSGRLLTPLPTQPSENEPDTEAFVIDEVIRLIKEAKDEHGEVVILVDACANRHHVKEETRELVKRTGFPVYSAPMGKGTIWEGDERYGGVSDYFPTFVDMLEMMLMVCLTDIHWDIDTRGDQRQG